MNEPYIKLYDKNGKLINPIRKGLNINSSLNRKQRRKLEKNIHKRIKP